MGSSPSSARRQATPIQQTPKGSGAISSTASRSPCVFLSHRQKEWGDACAALSREMEDRRICSTWFDMRADILTPAAMEEGISNSTVYAIFLSPSLALESNYVIFELKAAIRMGKPIVPIVDRSTLHGKRFIKDPVQMINQLKKKIGQTSASFHEPVTFIQRSGSERDAMIAAILKAGGHEFKPASSATIQSVEVPEVLIAGPAFSDVCDLFVNELWARGVRAAHYDPELVTTKSVKAVVFYVTKGGFSQLDQTLQRVKATKKGIVIVYETDGRRTGAFESPTTAVQEISAFDNTVQAECDFIPFGQITRRDSWLDTFFREVMKQVTGPTPLSVPFDMFALPRSLSGKYEQGTREWFFDELYQRQKRPEPLTLVIDSAGAGKSVLMAEVCRRGSALDPTQVMRGGDSLEVIGLHFFDSSQIHTTSAAACFGAVCVMLCSHIAEFRNHLPLDLYKQIQAKSPDELFDMLIATPLAKVTRTIGQGMKWIVIDGLDECVDAQVVLSILRRYSGPQNVKFLVSMRSSRTGADIRLATHQQSDMEVYLSRRLTRSWGIAAASARTLIITKIWSLSEGNFLWVSHQEKRLHELASLKTLTLQQLSQLPPGLDSMYNKYFAALSKQMGKDLYARVVGMAILCARSPLPESILATSLRVQDFAQRVREPASKILIFGSDDQIGRETVRAPHKSMKDWLEKNESFDLRSMHGDLAKILGKLASDAVESSDTFSLPPHLAQSDDQQYAVQHYVYHAIKGGDTKAAREWSTSFPKLLLWLACAGPETVLQDMELLMETNSDDIDSVALSASIIRLASHALLHDARELAGQVLGRTSAMSHKSPLVEGAEGWLKRATSRGLKVAVPSGHFSGLKNASGDIQHIVRGHQDSVFAVATNGTLILSCSNDCTARVLSDAGKTFVREFRGHTQDVLCGILVPEINGACWAATGSNDNTVQKWQAKNELELADDDGTLAFRGHESAVCSVFHDPSSSKLITGSWDKTARVWDWESGKMLFILGGHDETVYGVHLEGNRAITGADQIRIWEGNACVKAVRTNSSFVFCMTVTPTLIFAGADTKVDRVRIEDGELLSPIDTQAKICSLDVQNGWVAVGCEDHNIHIWNLDEGTDKPFCTLDGHTNWVAGVRFMSNQKMLVSGSWDKTVCLWRVPSTSRVESKANRGHSKYATSVDVLGDVAVTGSLDKTAKVWSIPEGTLLAEYKTSFGIRKVAWAPSKGGIECEGAEGQKQVFPDPRASGKPGKSDERAAIPNNGFHIAQPSASTVGFTADDDSGCVQIGKWLTGTSGNGFRIWSWLKG